MKKIFLLIIVLTTYSVNAALTVSERCQFQTFVNAIEARQTDLARNIYSSMIRNGFNFNDLAPEDQQKLKALATEAFKQAECNYQGKKDLTVGLLKFSGYSFLAAISMAAIVSYAHSDICVLPANAFLISGRVSFKAGLICLIPLYLGKKKKNAVEKMLRNIRSNISTSSETKTPF